MNYVKSYFIYMICKIMVPREAPHSLCGASNEHLNFTVLHTCAFANALQRNVTHCNTLQRTATHCDALQRTATHCGALHRTATHCNTLQHTATHCNTFQQTATRCNTLQHHPTPPMYIHTGERWRWKGLYSAAHLRLRQRRDTLWDLARQRRWRQRSNR